MMYKYIIFLVISSLLFFLSIHLGVFWDNVLFVSKIGGYFYEEGIAALPLPELLDPAKQPTFSMLHALAWKIMGKELWVSHLVQLPLVFLLLVQVYRFSSFFLEDQRYVWIIVLLVLIEPTVSSQLLLVSPEVFQVSFFFLGINSILYYKDRYLLLALLLLSIFSYRAMMLSLGVLIFDLVYSVYLNKSYTIPRFIVSRWYIYVIGTVPAFLYLMWRFLYIGWIYTSPNSPWIEYSGMVDFNGFIWNIAVLIFRFIDFGRIGIFMIVLFLLFKNRTSDMKIKTLFIVFISASVVVGMISLLSKNPMGHRYFMSSFIVLLVSVVYLIEIYSKNKIILLVFVMLGYVLGNLIVYPRNVSQGWDASLAFIPYFDLREKAVKYLDENNIGIKETATFFPNIAKLNDITMNGDDRSFIPFTGIEEYVLCSNVYNLTDEELGLLEKDYVLLKQFEKGTVEVEIYKKKY